MTEQERIEPEKKSCIQTPAQRTGQKKTDDDHEGLLLAIAIVAVVIVAAALQTESVLICLQQNRIHSMQKN